LIRGFEGYRPEATRLADGRWVIGYGHTLTAREGAWVSEDDAETLLIFDLLPIAQAIEDLVFTPLVQNQLDALVSLVFNIGVENFRDSAVLRRLNEGAMLEAAIALEAWRKADVGGDRIVADVLVRRRAAEKALFLTPQDGWVAAPSPMVEPKIDTLFAAAPADAEERALSPTERAAAKLSARLKVLVPEDDDEPASPFDAPADPVGEIEADAPVEVTAEPEPFPTASERRAPEPLVEIPLAFREPPPRDLRQALYGEPEPRPKVPLSAYAPLALLGVAGLAVFTGAMTWAFHAHPAGGAIGPLNVGVVIVGLIGVMCVASAVYFALEKRAAVDN
jgi:lysozyme